MRKKYKKLSDTPKNVVEKREFDKIYEKFNHMFKTDIAFIGIIGRKLFGNDKKKRYRLGDYIMDKLLLDLYKENKMNKEKKFPEFFR